MGNKLEEPGLPDVEVSEEKEGKNWKQRPGDKKPMAPPKNDEIRAKTDCKRELASDPPEPTFSSNFGNFSVMAENLKSMS